MIIWKKTFFKRIIIKKLFKEYLEDLVYESLDWEFEKWKSLNFLNNFSKLWDVKNLDKLIEIFKNLPAWLKSLYLENNNLWNKTWDELIEIFKSLPAWLKSLDLKFNYLWYEIWNELQKAFPNIKIIY